MGANCDHDKDDSCITLELGGSFLDEGLRRGVLTHTRRKHVLNDDD